MRLIQALPGAKAIWEDQEETQKQITAWDKQTTFARETAILDLIKDIPKKSVLDLGCGSGRWYQLVAPRMYVGVDDSFHMVSVAQDRLPQFVFHNMRLEDFKPTRKYDLALLIDVIIHCEYPETLLRGILKNMGGYVDYLIFTYYIHDYGDERYLEFGSPHGISVRSVEEQPIINAVGKYKWERIGIHDIADPAHALKNLRLRTELIRKRRRGMPRA